MTPLLCRTTYSLSTLVRTGNLVTANTTGANSLIPGENVVITGVTDASFDGTFQILSTPSSSQFVYQQFAPNASTTSGTVTLNGVYYYALQKYSNQLVRVGPFATDTQSARFGVLRRADYYRYGCGEWKRWTPRTLLEEQLAPATGSTFIFYSVFEDDLMSTYQLKIENPSIDGTTGHHMVRVHIVEQVDAEQTVHGIKEVYGIDSTALDLKFAGDVNKWLQWVGQEMLAKHIRRTKVQAELLTMHGKTIDLTENP